MQGPNTYQYTGNQCNFESNLLFFQKYLKLKKQQTRRLSKVKAPFAQKEHSTSRMALYAID